MSEQKAIRNELTQHWNELVKKVHYVIAYFIHASLRPSNDQSDAMAMAPARFL